MKSISSRSSRAASERGVVLFVALIVLIAMTLAGLALMRQMGIGTSIAGNVAFKENATSVADRGVEVARKWITENQSIAYLDSHAPNGNGYHSSWTASWGTTVDPTVFDWKDQSRVVTEDEGSTGNTMRIIIQRLCETKDLPANDPAQRCSDSPVDDGSSKGGGGYPSVMKGIAANPYYRITTKVEGPRNTVSYVQVLAQ